MAGRPVVVGSLRDLIPDDHLLRRIDKHVDLAWLRDDVEDETLLRRTADAGDGDALNNLGVLLQARHGFESASLS
jgi:hypothetical protein